ncbi:hypothetical protein [Arenimonas sp.]|uniref:hypothetical protein n=1 Tax=Arenimonas sp. TaxID=1872635 RepID=UPI002E32DD4E|nr:hypothetical protein [Arenimonas sp.]HEX4854373.1 hypothetical protein [Arenimonas sp.]
MSKIGNYSLSLAATAMSASIPVVSGIALARFYGDDEFGRFAYWLALLAPLVLLLGGGVRSLQLSNAISGLTDQDYLCGRLIGIGLVLVLALSSTILAHPDLYAASALAASCVISIKLSEAISENAQVVLFKRGEISKGALVQVSRSVVFLLSMLFLAIIGLDSGGAIILASAASVAMVAIFARGTIRASLSVLAAWAVIRRAATVSLSVFLITAMTSLPRVAAGSYGERDEFLAVSMIFPIVTLLTLGVTSMINVCLAGASRMDLRERNGYANRLIAYGALGGCVAALVLSPLAYIFGADLVAVLYEIRVAEHALYAATSVGASIAVAQGLINGAIILLAETRFLMVSVITSSVLALTLLVFLPNGSVDVAMSATVAWCFFGLTHCLLCVLRIRILTK